MTGETETREDHAREHGERRGYTVEVDGKEYAFEHSPVTALQLLAAAGIGANEGLLEVLEDGTQRKLESDEQVDLEDARRFKKRRRFRRG